jgi:hypothetical protein
LVFINIGKSVQRFECTAKYTWYVFETRDMPCQLFLNACRITSVPNTFLGILLQS